MNAFAHFYGLQGGIGLGGGTAMPLMSLPAIPTLGGASLASQRVLGFPLSSPSWDMASLEAMVVQMNLMLMRTVSQMMTGRLKGAVGRQPRRVASVGGAGEGLGSGRASWSPRAALGVGFVNPRDLKGLAAGNRSIAQAARYLGRNSIDVRGRLPRFTAAGGQTNNCADFVSSVLENTQGLRGHHVEVNDLERSLVRQGWKRVSAASTRPGDVWINPSRGHVQLVASRGATRTIGSNNDRPGHQVISVRSNDPQSAVYYTRRR